MREPLDKTSDFSVKEMHWLWSPGGGKTTGIEGVVQHRMGNAPSNILLVGQKDDTAARWMETRMIPSMKKNPALKGLMPSSYGAERHKIRKTTVILNHGYYLEAGGSAESNLQEKSMPLVILEEAWKLSQFPGRIQQAKQRTHDKWNSMILFVGQAGETHTNPDDDDSLADLYREWLKTDQRTFCFECPECHTIQPWKWDQMKWEKIETEGYGINWNKTSETIRLECSNPDCDAEWRDNVNDRRTLSESGRYVIQNKNAEKGFVGYHANAMCYWRIPWTKLVKQFIEAQEARVRGDLSLLQVFIMQRLAEFWKPSFHDEVHELAPGGYKREEFEDGKLIDGEVARTITVDVQQNSIWFLVTAFDTEGCVQHLQCGELLTFEEVEEVRKQYQVRDRWVLVDCGYRQDFVFQVCSKYNWTAVKGTQQDDFPVTQNGVVVRMPFSKPQSVTAGNGARSTVIHLAVNTIKDVVADLRAGRIGRFVVPDDVDPRFNDHLNAEVKRRIVSGLQRQEKDMWVRIGKRHNHLLDCMVYAIAFAMMKGLIKPKE